MNITYYHRGEPYINLCMEILKRDKKANGTMWLNFKGQFDIRENHEPISVALWIASYLTNN